MLVAGLVARNVVVLGVACAVRQVRSDKALRELSTTLDTSEGARRETPRRSPMVHTRANAREARSREGKDVVIQRVARKLAMPYFFWHHHEQNKNRDRSVRSDRTRMWCRRRRSASNSDGSYAIRSPIRLSSR